MHFNNTNNQKIKQFELILLNHQKQIEVIKQQIQQQLRQIHSKQSQPTMVQKCILVLLQLNKLKQSVGCFKQSLKQYQQMKDGMNKQLDRLSNQYKKYVQQMRLNFEQIEKKMGNGFILKEQQNIFEKIKLKDEKIINLQKRIYQLQIQNSKLKQHSKQNHYQFQKIKQTYQKEIIQLKNKINPDLITQSFTQIDDYKYKFTDEGQQCTITWSANPKRTFLQNTPLMEIAQEEDDPQQIIEIFDIKEIGSESQVILSDTLLLSQQNYTNKDINFLKSSDLRSKSISNQLNQDDLKIDTQIQQKITKFVYVITDTQKQILKQKFNIKSHLNSQRESLTSRKPRDSQKSKKQKSKQNYKNIAAKQFSEALKMFNQSKKSKISYYK